MLTTTANNFDAVTAVTGYLAEIGVNVTIEVIDPNVSNDRWLGGSFEPLRYGGWNNPESLLNLLVVTDGLISAYSDPAVDALIAEQAATLDIDARNEILWQITDILREAPMAIYLWSEPLAVGIDEGRVSGWVPNPKGFVPVTNVTVTG